MSPRPPRRPTEPIHHPEDPTPITPTIKVPIWFHPHGLHTSQYPVQNDTVEIHYLLGGTLCKIKYANLGYTVHMSLPLPAGTKITNFAMTYKCSNSRSYIKEIELLELERKKIYGGSIFSEKIPLKSTTEKEYLHNIDTYEVKGALALLVLLQFVDPADEIHIGPVGLWVVKEP